MLIGGSETGQTTQYDTKHASQRLCRKEIMSEQRLDTGRSPMALSHSLLYSVTCNLTFP